MSHQGMTRDEAISYVARDLGYGSDNANDWVLHAGFNDSWSHPAGVLVITWDSATNRYSVSQFPEVP